MAMERHSLILKIKIEYPTTHGDADIDESVYSRGYKRSV
jgi:hypothetical protein